jgi:hypothetical protein
MRRTLSARSLSEPATWRLSPTDPRRAEILAAHDAAVADGRSGYADPATGLYVLTARVLADCGFCCANGCRHCPYTADPSD